MTKDKEKVHTLQVNDLARVEGEGSLYLRVQGTEVADIRFKIFEPPRFFEALLRGRSYEEVPDITARICGICPVAYQMSSTHAIERAFGMTIPPPIRALRRLLYCGEWIESHTLHICMLHAPDFLGYPDAITMAKDHRDLVATGLRLKKAGNRIVQVVGGREIHPVNVRTGGFYRLPTGEELRDLKKVLAEAEGDAAAILEQTAALDFPEADQDYVFVALRHPDEYPMNEGRIVSTTGLDLDAGDWEQHFSEVHVPHSTALHTVLSPGQAFLTGPMARFQINHDRLPESIRHAAARAGEHGPCRNPFRSIIIRAVEVLYAVTEARRILDNWQGASLAAEPVTPGAGSGCAATEAPRGILWHRYNTAEDGRITEARIVAPTSQNQKQIENDLRRMVPDWLDLEEKELTHRCEQAIRNFDPCISCSTHFLKLELDRSPP